MSRLVSTRKNAQWSLINNVVTSLLNFLNRTVFIYTIGSLYLGVNGLFSNVLSLLSLTEMGVGTAINFSLYKPLAEGDNEKVKSLMHFYRKTYRVIALLVLCFGLLLLPALKFLIKGGEGIEHKNFIYLIFLFSTVSSYLISYKQVLISADQKNYVVDNFNSFFNILVFFVQFVSLVIWKNYYVYLIINFIFGLIKNISLNIYITSKYEYLKDKDIKPLEEKEKKTIFEKIKALMLHKVGEVCIYQTDNLIISAFIDVAVVGLVTNYTLITNSVNKIVMALFNAATASFGNLLVTEEKDKVLKVFKVYNYLGFLFYAWISVILWFLITPFIRIWIGNNMVVESNVIMLLIINFFLTGMRIPLQNIKTVAGIFEQDKWVPIVQSIINLVVSIVGVHYFGLLGVYIGTFASSMLPNIYRPVVVYKYAFGTSAISYFRDYLKYIIIIALEIVGIQYLIDICNVQFGNIFVWILWAIIISIVCWIVNLCLFIKTAEFQYIKDLAMKMLKRRN